MLGIKEYYGLFKAGLVSLEEMRTKVRLENMADDRNTWSLTNRVLHRNNMPV